MDPLRSPYRSFAEASQGAVMIRASRHGAVPSPPGRFSSFPLSLRTGPRSLVSPRPAAGRKDDDDGAEGSDTTRGIS